MRHKLHYTKDFNVAVPLPHNCIPLSVLQYLRKYRNSDFDEELHPSTPVGFSFLGDAVELDIPFHEAEHQGYTIEVDVTPCKVST